jgi:hypothetical protein
MTRGSTLHFRPRNTPLPPTLFTVDGKQEPVALTVSLPTSSSPPTTR